MCCSVCCSVCCIVCWTVRVRVWLFDCRGRCRDILGRTTQTKLSFCSPVRKYALSVCDMTHSYVTSRIHMWYDAFIWFKTQTKLSFCSQVRKYTLSIRVTTHSYVIWRILMWYDTFIREMMHSYDSRLRLNSSLFWGSKVHLLHMWRTHSYVPWLR